MNYNIAGLDLPHDHNTKLARILKCSLAQETYHPIIYPYWGSSHFGLDQVDIFQNLTDDKKFAILDQLNQALLTESYFLEKAGIGFMSKMVLLSDTLEERMLYATFAADETCHFSEISQFLTQEPTTTNDPFLKLYASLIENEDKMTLIFLTQVVLEGWGLTHYRNLANHCLEPTLNKVLQQFVIDEGRHQGTGLILYQSQSLSLASRNLILEFLTHFLKMIQVGPIGIVKAIAQITGGLSIKEKIQVFSQLKTETYSQTRLNLLRFLMRDSQLIETLDRWGYWKAFSPEICATIEYK